MKNDSNQLLVQNRNLVFRIGYYISLYGMVVILIWLGIFKFTPTEAEAIKPLIVSHPFLCWIYGFFTVQTVSNMIGVIEIITALFIILSPFFKIFRLPAFIGISVTFLFTLSFLFTMKDSFRLVDGVPVIDFFILKDIVFLGFGAMVLTLSGNNKEISK